MAGLEADTSSYNQPLPVSPLETVKNIAGVQQQKQQIESSALTIDKQKLELANQGLGYMTRAMGSLGPEASKADYLAVAQNAVKMGLVKPEMLSAYQDRLNAAKDSKSFFNEFMTAAATHEQAINYHLGTRQDVSNGQTVTPAVTSVKPGFGVKPISQPIQQQIPPTQPVATPQGTQLQGPTAPQLPVGQAPVKGGLPGQGQPMALPVAPKASGPTGPTVDVTPTVPTTFDNRFSAARPSGPMTSQPPMFEEGKKQLAEDQALATTKLTAIKPPIQALSMMKDLRSGPGTETYNKAVAFLKANNILPTQANDPTAIYQEVNKYLSQYVQGSGTRSDADLASREASSPNVGTQINPALVKLTKNAIALDRVQAARAAAFEDTDYSKYGAHRSTFPAQVDERAFGIDLMEPKERQALMQDMKKKANTPEGKKFWKSLSIADKQGILNQ